MSFFPGLRLAYWDMVTLAVKDILDTDPQTRGWFSGSTAKPSLDPTGAVDITPGSTSLLGTGSNWLTTMPQGSRFLIGDQVVQIEEVTSDTDATIKVAHADGAIGEDVFRAARSERVNAVELLPDMAMPYYTIGVGVLPDVQPEVGQLQVDPSVTITVVFPRREAPLADDEASWTGIAGHWLALLAPKKGVNNPVHRLCVPRFGDPAPPLVSRISTFGAGGGTVVDAGEIIIAAPILISWQGMDPLAAQEITPRW